MESTMKVGILHTRLCSREAATEVVFGSLGKRGSGSEYLTALSDETVDGLLGPFENSVAFQMFVCKSWSQSLEKIGIVLNLHTTFQVAEKCKNDLITKTSQWG